ncbi:sulfhydryl oxidase 2 isoform X5 [Capsicum annuum]|uniref:sulfhydryl oxidase 2 isoform X5 n=1 Tax=Capsicum annuum TaxID=4072 RepID=UPI0007BF16D0|nr:sulfhydryl oxidase 2 isoform X5 [Capsicum annuum]
MALYRRSALITVAVIMLLISILGLCTVTSGSHERVILRAIIKEEKSNKNGEFAIDLNATNFDSVFNDTPTPFAILEFFAHWCPACRNYKPHYEKVARLFNGPDASHPGIILMTRVDCALTINSNLCDKFSVTRFPMLFWGPPKKFIGGGWDPKQEKSEIIPIENGQTADILLGWINKQLGRSYGFDDGKHEKEHLQANTSDSGQIAKAIYDIEEATFTAFGIILDHKMITPATRASLIKFLQLLVAHHPSKRCRKGSAEILVNFDDLCPSQTMSVNNEKAESCTKKGALGNYHICGKEVPRGYWMYCRGSKNDTRGFSCGLWVLLHSLSVRVEDGESNMAFRSTCDFIHNFFICEECRQHFYGMCSSISSPFKKARDFALWLWSAHNKVNERLAKEEASLETGDPEFPKAIWPPKKLCSSCYLKTSKENGKIEWDENEVFKFLVSYYGKGLVTLQKEMEQQSGSQTEKIVAEEVVGSTHAVVVPVGAALAIAVASCAFGALAYIWRSRQKNRKYKYNSLKNI